MPFSPYDQAMKPLPENASMMFSINIFKKMTLVIGEKEKHNAKNSNFIGKENVRGIF